MLSLVIAIVCLLAFAIGYFVNIYMVFALVVVLCFLYFKEVCQPNPYPGTSEKMGGIIIMSILLGLFIIITLTTSIIFNQDRIVAFFDIIWHYTSILFLR